MRSKYKTDMQATKEDRILLAALAGICTVALIQILGLTDRDIPINIALYCFAIAIPMLSTSVYALVIESAYKSTVMPWYIDAMFGVGIVGALVGTACLFWHFSWVIATTFLICGAAGIAGLYKFFFELEELNEAGRQQEKDKAS